MIFDIYINHIIRLLPLIIQHSFFILRDEFYSGKQNCCISLGIPKDCIYCSTLFVYSPDQYLFSLKYLFWENKFFLVTIWIFMFSLIFDVVVGNFLGHYKNFVRAFWKIKTLYYDKWNLYYVYWWTNGWFRDGSVNSFPERLINNCN